MSHKINIAVIENYISENSMSRTAFCNKCGISMYTYKKIVNGKDFRLNALLKIARAIGVEFTDFFKGV